MGKLTKERFEQLTANLKAPQYPMIRIGMSTCGLAAGAQRIYDHFEAYMQQSGATFNLKKSGCIGMCYAEPIVEIKMNPKDSTLYGKVDTTTAEKILQTHLKLKKPIDHTVLSVSPKEQRIVLRNIGVIDPESIEEYMALDGYRALVKALFEKSPEDIINEMKKSNLRGRGGAGFPTWMKWSFARKASGEEKFVICNGDEGDPGAYMDRSVLEGDPHSVIEGMIIAGYAIGASNGFFYIRAEYPLAISRIKTALNQARENGLLGKNILGSTFSFDLDIRLGAGAFVCGEESALMASIEGKRGTPKPRPPFPTDVGLWGKPTSINNVETFANVAPIILKGGNWFSSIGVGKSTGTKVFALTGKVAHSGLVEVPMGTPLADIVFDIGGGSFSGNEIIAVQTGGPSGGLIPKEHFNTPVTYEHLGELGSIMGSGGMIVLDKEDCFVDIIKFYLGFCVDESCGKCAPCRLGGKQLLLILEKISKGEGKLEDLDALKRISSSMQKASLCGLGQTAPNPVVSSLLYFENEYRDHILNKKCRASKCLALVTYTIIPEECVKCGMCYRSCPVNAISGDKKTGYVIDQKLCVRCAKCYEVCKFSAITRG